jgi:tRNA U34 5-methylaminomethyl-2-thiouridine-forming methyltransferase MnmC
MRPKNKYPAGLPRSKRKKQTSMTYHIIETGDGSRTIEVPELGVAYKSYHGAAAESQYVFVEQGLSFRWREGTPPLDVLEIGFGTGLNALHTVLACAELRGQVCYTGVEYYPLGEEMLEGLNYEPLALLQALHAAEWEVLVPISEFFSLKKRRTKIDFFCEPDSFDLIYFDAFAPSAQPHLWELPVISNMFRSLRTGGVLVTYCAKGVFRRTLKEAGFVVDKVPGPPGKREMTRAIKV